MAFFLRGMPVSVCTHRSAQHADHGDSRPPSSASHFFPTPAVVICGYQGFGNIGDEAVWEGLLAALPLPSRYILLLSGNPSAAEKRYGVQALARTSPKAFAAICQADLVILGGGTLLQQGTSMRSLLYYLSAAALASLAGTPWIVVGGIDPLTGLAKRLTAMLLSGRRQTADMKTPSKPKPLIPQPIALYGQKFNKTAESSRSFSLLSKSTLRRTDCRFSPFHASNAHFDLPVCSKKKPPPPDLTAIFQRFCRTSGIQVDLLKRFLSRSSLGCSALFLRDSASFERAGRLTSSPRFKVPDSALNLPPAAPCPRLSSRTCPRFSVDSLAQTANETLPVALFCPKGWTAFSKMIELAKQAACSGYRCLFVAFAPEDIAPCRRAARVCMGTYLRPTTPSCARAVIAAGSILYAGRLHALLFARQAGIPAHALIRTAKLSSDYYLPYTVSESICDSLTAPPPASTVRFPYAANINRLSLSAAKQHKK